MTEARAKALSDLEWPRVALALADRAQGPRGKREAAALPFLSGVALSTALAEAKEARDAQDRGAALPLFGVRDIDEALERVRIGAPLSGPELRDVASTLSAARGLRRWLGTHRDRAPALYAACATDGSLDAVEDEIASAFDADGTLSDHASPKLRELRGEHHAARDRMISRLEELMRKYAHVLADAFWTEREGRFVLPLRTDAHERFPGIVHATSASGATLFVEPRAFVSAGNRLKVLDGEVRREEDAVLARLTLRLADVLPSASFAVEALARADVRAATAKLADDLALEFADVADGPVVELVGVRHPLLVLDGVDVVASDVTLAAGRALVISGPNAGGKTVVLKTVGLAALMLRAGLPIPAKRGSRLGVFHDVLTDVGDDQSLTKNLSTFSAHVTSLARILDRADGSSLVLLDEVATGTDPREGEALAAAVLDGLCRRGAAVIATTHYEGLKALAASDARFKNASVGFDLATMTPTFRLAIGIPGASSALAVARRFGVPAPVLERAEAFLSREDRDFEKLVASLQGERRALELAKAAAEHAQEQAEAKQRELDAAIEEIKRSHEHEALRETSRLVESVRRARDGLRDVEARLRNKRVDDREIRQLSRVVDDVAAKISLGGELEPTVREAPLSTATDLERGARVFVPRLRADAEILDVLPGGQLRVAAGSLKLTVSVEDVRAPRVPAERAKGKRALLPSPAQGPLEAAIQTKDTTCDLRGLDAVDATKKAEQFLDRSMNEGRGIAFLVHGHGTGALRAAVRSSLATSKYVREMRPGEPSEGGDGVTVVWLRG